MSTASADWVPAFLAMARELWVLRDRQRVLETLLAERDVVAARAVDLYQPSPQLQAQIDAECREFIQRLATEIRSAAPEPAAGTTHNSTVP